MDVKSCLLLAGFLLLSSTPAQAQVFPYPVETAVLRNGLQLVMVPRPGTGLLSYYTLVRVGSRNEVEPGRSGYAHFFEHMMFRGTPRFPQEKYEAVIKQFGAHNNAYTDHDVTVYTITGRAEGLDKYVEIESDRFQFLQYSRAGFETEAKAVLGEYNKQKSNPRSALHEALVATAFTRHPYRHTTLGFEADIRAMPQGFDYSREFFRRYYTPDNLTVVVVGDFEPARARELVEKAYGVWKGKAVLARIEKEPPQKKERRVDVEWKSPARTRVMMAWHTPASTMTTVKEVAAAGLLTELLFGETSPLHQDLVLERELCDDLGAYFRDHRDPNLLVMGAVVRDEASLGAVETAIDAALARVASEGVEPARLEAVKSHERYGFLMQLEKDSVIADVVVSQVQLTGSLQWMEDSLAAQQAVTNEDLKAFVRTYLTPENRTVATLRVPGGGAP